MSHEKKTIVVSLAALLAAAFVSRPAVAAPPAGGPRIPVAALKRCETLHPSSCEAFARLAGQGEQSLQAGLTMVAHRDPWIRRAGARLLLRVADQRAAEPLVALLADPDANLRVDAMDALGTCGRPEDAAAVRAQLAKETERAGKVAALRALGRLRDPASAPVLLGFAEDPDAHVAEAAITGLGMLRNKAAAAKLAELLTRPETPAFHALAAAKALAMIGDRAAGPALMTAAGHSDIEVRRASIRGLGVLGDTAAIPLLVELLSDTPVLAAVTDALGAIDDPRTLDPLWAMLRAEDLPDEVRRSVLQAFARRRVETAVPELLAMLRDKDSPLLVDVIRALGEIRDERSFARLIEALESERPEVVGAANTALCAISGRHFDPDPAHWKRWLSEREELPERSPDE